MKWPWRNLGTITPWLVSTAAQDSESFCVSLHFNLAIAFLTFGVSSLCSSILPHSSKGGKSNIYTFWNNQQVLGILFVNGSNISSVIWLCSFAFSLLSLLLSWWHREFWNEFVTGVALLRNIEKVGLSESLLGLELGLALNPSSSPSQLLDYVNLTEALYASVLSSDAELMEVMFWPIGITAQVLGTFDSEKWSVGNKSKSFPDRLGFVYFRAMVLKARNASWEYIRI